MSAHAGTRKQLHAAQVEETLKRELGPNGPVAEAEASMRAYHLELARKHHAAQQHPSTD